MKAAIFDVDGTLLDSMSVWEDIGERYLASQNITAEKNLRAALHTMSLEQGAAWMNENYQLDMSISQIIEEVLKIVSDFYRFEAPLKPGVKKTLEWFKERNIQMTVATSGNRELTEAALARNGILDYFEQIYTCTETGTDTPLTYSGFYHFKESTQKTVIRRHFLIKRIVVCCKQLISEVIIFINQ